MKHYLRAFFGLLALVFLSATSTVAAEEEKIVIAMQGDDFRMAETDISDLAIGESHTIETESGKVIDILRTAEGAEVYIDGELLDMNSDNNGLHEQHMLRKHVEIICDDDDECDKNVVILDGDEVDVSEWMTDEGDNVFIHREVELTCTDDDEETNCADKMVWVSEDGEVDLEKLHEMHINGENDGETHKLIMIKKHKVIKD